MPRADSIAGNGCSNYWGQYVRPYQEPNAAPFTRDLPTAMCGYTPKALNTVQKVKGKQTGKNVTVGIIYAPATTPMGAPLIDAFHRIVDNDSLDTISDSWGGGGARLDDATKAAYKQVFVQASAQGITILFSSGDRRGHVVVRMSTQ